MERRPPYADRFRLTRATRLLLVAALATGVGLAALLVRTFHGPALDAAREDAPPARSPVTLQPGPPRPSIDAGPPLETPPLRRFADSRPPATASRSPALFTDADLRAYAARRGTSAVGDAGYRLALRQRRVDDLRARLAAARSAEERAALQEWLESALRDLEAERDRP